MTPPPLVATWTDAHRFVRDGAVVGASALPASFLGIATVLIALRGPPQPQFWWLVAWSSPAGLVVGAVAGAGAAALAAVVQRWGPAVTLAMGPLLGVIATAGVWAFLAVVTNGPLVPRSGVHWRDLGMVATAAVAVVAPGWVTYVLSRWRDRPVAIWVGGVAVWCGAVGSVIALAAAALDL